MRTPTLLALAALLSAGAASAQDAGQYAVDFTVMRGGTAVSSARTLIVEGGQAEVNLVAADGAYTFTADLQPEQGDGGDSRLVLEAYVNRDGEDLANPRLVMSRGGSAKVQLGSSRGAADALEEGVQITLTPVGN